MAQIIEFEIEQDEYPESPREWGNLGTFIMQHGNYEFGDRIFEINGNGISFEDDFKYHLHTVYDCSLDDVIYLPVYMYNHSGITISTTPFSCKWDSGQIGYIYAVKDDIRKEYNVKRISPKLREQTLSILRAEIQTLDQYLIGDIYGFNIEYDDGSNNSCWGFYGNNPKTNDMYDHWSNEEIKYYEKEYNGNF